MTLQDWESILAISGAAVAAAAAFHWRVVRPLRHNITSLLDMIPVVDVLKAEFSPNGGSSMKDKINSIDRELHILKFHDRLSQDMDDRPILEFDVVGRCIYVNRAAIDLFDIPAGDWYGNGWLRAIAPHDRVSALTSWLDSVKHGLPYELDSAGEADQSPAVTFKAMPIAGSDGRPLGYFCIVEPAK